jgi:alpha-L-fucosidase
MGEQLDELLTRYGPVHELWFDAVDGHQGSQYRYDGPRFLRQIRAQQPLTIVNDRLHYGGDFSTPEQFIPRGVPVKGVYMASPDHSQADKLGNDVPPLSAFSPWETCMTINNTWAYNPHDQNYKSTETILRNMVEVFSRGGNFLLDVGPTPEGLIQPEFVERLEAIGPWVVRNAQAIFETTYGPIQGHAQVRSTSRGKRVYLFVVEPLRGDIALPSLRGKILHANWLASKTGVKFKQDEKGITLSPAIPEVLDLFPVIELEMSEPALA